jgi:hypothetical protein
MKLDLPDEDVELLFNLVMDAPLPRRRTDRLAFTMAQQMQEHKQAEAAKLNPQPTLPQPAPGNAPDGTPPVDIEASQ